MAKLELVHVYQRLFAYDSDLWEKVWEAANGLSIEAYEAPCAYSIGSVRDHLAHITTVNARWHQGLIGTPNSINYQLPVDALATRESTYHFWRQTEDLLLKFVAEIDEATMDKTLPELSGPTWEVLQHLVNHGTDHRAQVLRLLNEQGAETIPQDFIFWAWGFGPWQKK